MNIFLSTAMILIISSMGTLGAEEPVLAIAKENAADSSMEIPQLGYRIMMGYIQGKEKTDADSKVYRVGIPLALGGSLLGAAGITYFYGDSISQNFYGTDMNPKYKMGASLGLGISGLVFVGIGGLAAVLPPTDYRLKYIETINATNPAYQEALAVAALKSIGEDARNARLISGTTFLGISMIVTGVNISKSLSEGKAWYTGLSVTSSDLVYLVSGITTLLFPTPEEGLYDKYLLAKSTYENQ